MERTPITIYERFVAFVDSRNVLHDSELIDMTPLINSFRNIPHITVTMFNSKSLEFYQNMAAAIIINFCQNPVCTHYPFHGLQNIRRIIEKDHCNDDSAKLQLELLVHVSKMNIPGSKSAHYLGKFERMTVYNPTEDWSKNWLELAEKVISNKSVVKQTNDLIGRIFGIESGINQRKVQVKFVDTTEAELRGFAGFDYVYINFTHFDTKRYTERKFDDCEVLMGMDIATVVLHEYSHIRIRQELNDINMTTPTKIPRESIIRDLEFGRIAERHFFGAVPDWQKSYNRGTESGTRLLKFAADFVSAISSEEEKELPSFPVGLVLENRSGVVSMTGADMTTDFSIE